MTRSRPPRSVRKQQQKAAARAAKFIPLIRTIQRAVSNVIDRYPDSFVGVVEVVRPGNLYDVRISDHAAGVLRKVPCLRVYGTPLKFAVGSFVIGGYLRRNKSLPFLMQRTTLVSAISAIVAPPDWLEFGSDRRHSGRASEGNAAPLWTSAVITVAELNVINGLKVKDDLLYTWHETSPFQWVFRAYRIVDGDLVTPVFSVAMSEASLMNPTNITIIGDSAYITVETAIGGG